MIQISSVSKDYLVDPFPLWSELPMLNEITVNPRIVKILHGCDSDIDWLQRDLSIYLRNVFDTHQACFHQSITRGTLAKLRREDKYPVSMLEEAENAVFFKYSGVDGMKLDRRVYATNTPLASFTTLLVMAGVSNTVAYYESAQPVVDLQFRFGHGLGSYFT